MLQPRLTPGKQAKGAGQGCAQQHRRDLVEKEGEPFDPLRRNSQIAWPKKISWLDWAERGKS
jgi:hypothetical protein